MKDHHSWCGDLLAGVTGAIPHHTCDIELHPGTALAEVRVERHFTSFTPEDNAVLAVALLYEGSLVRSFAFFCVEDGGFALRLSNGETYDLEGDLSQAQLINILAGICGASPAHVDIKIFSRKGDPVMAAIETIDDPFYDSYSGETDLTELLSPVIRDHTGPDCCQDYDGTYARTGGFTGRCFPLQKA